jgi:hypothetical protein
MRGVDARIPVRQGWLNIELRADAAAQPGASFLVPYKAGEATLIGRVRPIA